MKESVRGILRYPLSDGFKKLNTALTILDGQAIEGNNTKNIYRLPGRSLENGEKRESALVASIREELSLEVNKILYLGSVFTSQYGDEHIYLIESATGNIQQPFFRGDVLTEGCDPKKVRGIGFINPLMQNQIPAERLQEHVRYVIANILGKEVYHTLPLWSEGPPRYSLPGYFISGNQNLCLYDWHEQCRRNRKGFSFTPFKKRH